MNQPIAIVGMGCVLPGAENPEQFWQNCIEGKSAIKPISEARWDSSLYVTDNKFDIDKTYSVLAAEVTPDVYSRLTQKFNFHKGEATRMELVLLESCTQALQNLSLPNDKTKVGFILGAMSPDEEHFFAHAKKVDRKLLNYLKENLKSEHKNIVKRLDQMIDEKEWPNPYTHSVDRILTSEILEKVASKLNIYGLRFIIDAACASSLASVDQCCQFLQSGEWDMAIAAGAETNLAPGSFSLFSRVGGLASNQCLPFDGRTEGLVQGEGAGVVILKRLADAVNDKNKILAIIEAVDGSSDGKTSSLFQPNDKGQNLAFHRVYSQLPSKKISYLEGHGTGTVVGDKTEVAAAAEFFNDQSLLMGSVKGLTGHTKGTAGVANLIKAIHILRDKKIPGMRYVSQPLPGKSIVHLVKNITDLPVELSDRVGVSAFGFGGTNYHTAISGPDTLIKYDSSSESKVLDELEDVFLIGSAEINFSDFNSEWFSLPESVYRVPPQSIPYIDKAQLLAVKVAELAMKNAKLKYDEFPNDDVMVVSSSILGLDIVEEQTGRVRSTMMMEAVKKYVTGPEVPSVLNLIEKYRSAITPFSEDSAAGVLNNVIAGRVCNAFDFHGRSYNIEARNNTYEISLKLIHDEIAKKRAPVVFLITLSEDVDADNFDIKRNKISCQIFSSKRYIEKNFVKPQAQLTIQNKTYDEIKRISSRLNFKVEVTPVSNSTYHKSGVLFPGQGSIFPNRYVNYVSYSETFKKRFAEADRLAQSRNLPLVSELAYEDSKRYDSDYPTISEALMRNLFQLTVEVTLFDLLNERGIHPEILTGHSFGEFPALHCAGYIDFETAFDIVLLREKCTPQPGERGSLVVVAISEQKLRALQLETPYSIANINSKEQLVLAVEIENLSHLLNELRKKRIPAKELKSVGRPYHSEILKRARIDFENKLHGLDLKINPSEFGFISSVNGKYYPPATLISKEELIELLSYQLINPVYFDKQIERAATHNLQGFIELGLDRTLCGFVNTALHGSKKYTVVTAEELLLKKKKNAPKKVFKLSSNKYVELVSKIVSSVTGYKIEEITLEQQFEEDLRIDSIKKAEIFFRVLEETQGVSDPSIEVSSFKQVGDVVEFFQQNEGNLKAQKNEMTKATFQLCQPVIKPSPLIFKPRYNHAELIKIDLDSACSNTFNLEHLNSLSSQSEKQTIVLTIEDFVDKDNKDLGRLLKNLYGSLVKILEMTDYPTLVLHAKTDSKLFRGLKSFIKSIRLEMKSFHFKSIVDPELNYFSSWQSESEDHFSFDVVYKNKQRHIVQLQETTIQALAIKKKVIFAVGGAKGILHQFFSSFDINDDNILYFTGRSSIDSEHVKTVLNDFKTKFKNVYYLQMDVLNAEEVDRALKHIHKSTGKIDVLLDASGKEVSRLFENKSQEEIQDEIASKLSARSNLSKLLKDYDLYPTAQIYFNSIAATYGNHGQSVYAFTNGYVSGDLEGIHLYWPPLDSLGMTSDKGILMKLKMMGADLLPKEQVYPFLNAAIQCGELTSELQLKSSSRDLNIVSLRNHFMMNLLSASPDSVRHIFGQVQINKVSQTMKVVDKTTSVYLQDHVVNSNCIAPGSMGLATFVLAGKTFFQCLPVAENFEMHNFILLDRGPIEVSLSISFKDCSTVSAKSMSKYENYEVILKNNVHINSGQNNLEPASKIENIKIDQEFELNEFYSKKFIDYGPSYQVLRKVGIVGNNQIFTISNLSSFKRTGEFEFDYLTSLYEACVQTAATKCLLELKGLALPTGIGRLEHFNITHSDVVYMTTTDLNPGHDAYNFSTDVYAYNEQGHLILKMENVKLKKFVQLKEFPLVVKKTSSALCR